MQPWRGFPRLSGRSTAGERDAENRLLAVVIKATGHRSEFGYDGLGRRVEIIEKDPDATQTLQVTSDKKYLWDGTDIAEERTADGGTVTKRFYQQGFVDSDGTSLYYTRDHLGSIRELTDSTQAVRARYEYDPWGRVTKISGDRDSVFQYTGHMWHAQSGLFLTLFRAYDPNLGRWISRDPLNEMGGINLYGYVYNNPIRLIDVLGLDGLMPPAPPGYNSQTWSRPAIDDSGKWHTYDPDGNEWISHSEDKGHWRHWDKFEPNKNKNNDDDDDDDGGGWGGGRKKCRVPQKSKKPWEGQKKKPYGDQSPVDPNGDAPPFDPYKFYPMTGPYFTPVLPPGFVPSFPVPAPTPVFQPVYVW